MTKDYIVYKGKHVGYVENDRFFTERDEKTIFRKLNSVNISQAVIDRLEATGIRLVVFRVRQKGEIREYCRNIADINRYDTYTQGDDVQRVVPLWDLRHNIRHQRSMTITEYVESQRNRGEQNDAA